jgi:diguanylate cyclase (GGDEF)-like protein
MNDVSALISFVGGVTQFGGCVLFALIFRLLQRRAGRPYFGRWSAAWLALAAAMGALILRRLLVPGDPSFVAHGGVLQHVLHGLYQVAKMLAYALFALGALRFVRGTELGPRAARAWAAALAAYTLASVALASSLHALVVWQAPVAGGLLGFAGLALLLGLPARRRSLGTRMTGAVLCLVAVLWLLYVPAFGRAAGILPLVPDVPAFVAVVQYNSFFDFLLQTFLGVGMVVILMEDAKRDAEDAHDRLAVALAELRSLVHTDPLTGCLNRQAYVELFERGPAPTTRGAVVVVDLDNLKAVNDQYGHSVGDELLRQAAQALRTAAPAPAWLFRWGGDEFLLVIAGFSGTEAQQAVEAAFAARAPLPLAPGEDPCRLEASVGAGEFAAREELERVIRDADRVMYSQKSRRKRPRGTPPAVV